MYYDVIPRKPPERQQSLEPAPAGAPRPKKHDLQPIRPSKRAGKSESWRSILTTIAILLLAPLFALLLTAYAFQTYQVDGPSMEATLQPNDRLVVWKVPRTWARITGTPYIPERGSIVVFTEPRLDQFGQAPGKQLIKRVMALPGDRIEITEGVLAVYNTEHPQGFNPDQNLPPGAVMGSTNETLDTVVPENHIFVMGDNRGNSLDSRSFGPVHADNIVGNLAIRVLPIDNMRRF